MARCNQSGYRAINDVQRTGVQRPTVTPGEYEADYVVIGAGASAMAFVDEMLQSSDATFDIVDRRHAPGGHWNDAYPFVRLHQDSTTYGVGSRRVAVQNLKKLAR